MPNWSRFTVAAFGDDADIRVFKAEVEAKSTPQDDHFVVHLKAEGDHACIFLDRQYYMDKALGEKAPKFPIYLGKGRLLLTGESRWFPPLEFVQQASIDYPKLEFELRATTEHELFEKWSFRAGVSARIDARKNGFGAEHTWYVMDGIVLDQKWVDSAEWG